MTSLSSHAFCHHTVRNSCVQEPKFLGNTLAHLRTFLHLWIISQKEPSQDRHNFTHKPEFQSDGSATVFHNRPLISIWESPVGAESAIPPSKYWYALLSDDAFNFMFQSMYTGKGMLPNHSNLYVHSPGNMNCAHRNVPQDIKMREKD